MHSDERIIWPLKQLIPPISQNHFEKLTDNIDGRREKTVLAQHNSTIQNDQGIYWDVQAVFVITEFESIQRKPEKVHSGSGGISPQ